MKTLTSITLLALSMTAWGQIKVGDNPTNVNSDAVLEVESANQGVLFPRVALLNINSSSPLANHTEGMVVYNTTSNAELSPGFYFNNGSYWERLASTSDQEWVYDAPNSIIQANRSATSGQGVYVSDQGQLWLGAVPSNTRSIFHINSDGTTPQGLDVNLKTVGSRFILYQEVRGGYVGATFKGSGFTYDLIGGDFFASVQNSTRVFRHIGIRSVSHIKPGYDGRILDQEGIRVDVQGIQNSGRAERVTGVNIMMPCQNCTGAERVGLKIADVLESTYETGNTTAFSIYTNAGQVSFGDALEIRSNDDALRSIQGVSSSGATFLPLTLNPSGEEVRIGSTNLEIGTQNTGNRLSFIDFHSEDNVDFNARVYRDAGTNGAFVFHQGVGTGDIQFKNGTNTQLTIAADGTVEQMANTAMVVASGTTAERPANPVPGSIRLNTTTGNFEGFNGTSWVDISQ